MFRSDRSFVRAMLASTLWVTSISVAVVTPPYTHVELLTREMGGAGDDWFGNRVAISGNVAVVAAHRDDLPSRSNAGSVSIYRDAGFGWAFETQIVAADGVNTALFGSGVAIDGDTVVVGAPGHAPDISLSDSARKGAVYVYRYNGSAWTQEAMLSASDRLLNDSFGWSVALHNNVLVVGATGVDADLANQGAIYVFVRSGTTWSQVEKIVGPAPVLNFGHRLALKGNVLAVAGNDPAVVGTPRGRVYLYHDNGAAWAFEAMRESTEPTGPTSYGADIAIDGETVVVGAPFDGFGTLSEIGSAYIYDRNGGSWNLTLRIRGVDAQENQDHGIGFLTDFFGQSVAINGDALVVGATLDGGDPGAAYVFRHNGAQWAPGTYIRPRQPFLENGPFTNVVRFGEDLALNDNQILIAGAPRTQMLDQFFNTVADVGCFYVIDINNGPGDADADGLDDYQETEDYGTDPNDADGDDDGMTDGAEIFAGGHPFSVCPDPFNPDSDGDGNLDGADGSTVCDFDNDGLTIPQEVLHGTSPIDPDSDDDGLLDGAEVALAAGSGCPSPLDSDSDNDGQFDGAEVAASTNPCAAATADADGDGLNDTDEALHGTNPNNPDTDADGLNDGTEVTMAAGSGCPSPINDDSDNDGITDGNELTAGSGPCDTDSDDDGLSDGNEGGFGTDLMDADSDDDGLFDGTEVDAAMGSGCPSPLDPDSDDDSLSDGDEVVVGTSTCDDDTDGDGLGDAEDPTPTVPGVPPVVLEDLTRATALAIFETPQSMFHGPNNNVRQARRAVLAGFTSLAANAIANGNYNVAIALLTVVEQRIDGDSPPPDWMPDSNDKSMLHSDVETLIILLEFIE